MDKETLLYDIVHDYIISENFASDTEGANKVMLKLSDELMEEIYERTMTASEKRKDTMLKKKYDDSDMKKNMQGQYGKEEGKKVYFATIRKQAMKKEEVEQEDPSVKAKMKRQAMIKKQVLMKKLQAVRAGAGADITSSYEPEGNMAEVDECWKTHKQVGYKKKGGKMVPNCVPKNEEVEMTRKAYNKIHKDFKSDNPKKPRTTKYVPGKGTVSTPVKFVDEAKYEAGASTYGKMSIRNKRAVGYGGNAAPPEERRKAHDERMKKHKAVKEEVGISSTVMKDKAKKEAMLRMKERDAVAKKLRKEEMGNIAHTKTKKGGKTIINVNTNDEADAQKSMKNDPKYILGKTRVQPYKEEVKGDKVVKIVKAVADEKKRKNALQIQKYIGEVKRDEYGDPVGGPKITKKQLKKNLAANEPDEDHTNTTAEGYGSERVGPALTVARAIDKVNPRPKPNSKRTMASRALKMASIKKDEKIRKRKENPYSTDKKLKMVATSIRDRVKQKAKSIMKSEDYIPEEGYDVARDQGKVRPSKDKKDATTMPPSKEMKKTQKVNKGPSALEIIKKKYGKSVMGTKK